MRRHTILAAVVAATAAFAAQPAAASTPDPINPPELSQPPDMCFESPQFAVCSSDVGPLTQQALSDPAGTAVGLAGLVVHIVCSSSSAVTCEIG